MKAVGKIDISTIYRGTYTMLNAFMQAVSSNINFAYKKRILQVAMLDIQKAPVLDVRYSPINAPELRLFQ